MCVCFFFVVGPKTKGRRRQRRCWCKFSLYTKEGVRKKVFLFTNRAHSPVLTKHINVCGNLACYAEGISRIHTHTHTNQVCRSLSVVWCLYLFRHILIYSFCSQGLVESLYVCVHITRMGGRKAFILRLPFYGLHLTHEWSDPGGGWMSNMHSERVLNLNGRLAHQFPLSVGDASLYIYGAGLGVGQQRTRDRAVKCVWWCLHRHRIMGMVGSMHTHEFYF